MFFFYTQSKYFRWSRSPVAFQSWFKSQGTIDFTITKFYIRYSNSKIIDTGIYSWNAPCPVSREHGMRCYLEERNEHISNISKYIQYTDKKEKVCVILLLNNLI